MKRLVLCGFLLAACGPSGETVDRVGEADLGQIPARYATVIVTSCTPDAVQTSALAGRDVQHVVREVVLLCAVPRATGAVGPADPSARAQLNEVAASLRNQGYKVKLGVSFTDETAERYDGTETATYLADVSWRDSVVRDLAVLAGNMDGVDLDFQTVPSGARGNLTSFVQSLSAAIRPSKQLEIMAPPSTTEPSDVPGGGAVDLAAMASFVDRVRVMTLDFAAPGPGPTVDPGWAVDAVRFAQSKLGAVPVDVSMPLYGNDVCSLGTTNIDYAEAVGLEDSYRASPSLGPSGSPYFSYTDESGRVHEVWYDDATSTLRTLRAWDSKTLPLSVGVVFYGLGAEDPALWPALARATP